MGILEQKTEQRIKRLVYVIVIATGLIILSSIAFFTYEIRSELKSPDSVINKVHTERK
jgi:hypothetical protein